MAQFRSTTTVSVPPDELLALLVKYYDLPQHALDDGEIELGPRFGVRVKYVSERQEKGM